MPPGRPVRAFLLALAVTLASGVALAAWSANEVFEPAPGPMLPRGSQLDRLLDEAQASPTQRAQAHQIFDKYHSDYLLTCPNSSTTTIFTSEAPKGFYAQLEKGQVPDWLTPVPLGPNSPFRMWKIAR